MTKEIISEFNVGIGDEAMMVGRFINHEGKQSNMPALRFGNIAMMPKEPIWHDGHQEESFLVEVRSIGGYSGSPVWVYIPPFSFRHKDLPSGQAQPLVPNSFGWLLGVNWAYIRDREPVREGSPYFQPVGGSYGGWNVYSNTGMAAVVPVWKLNDLMNLPTLKAGRDQKEGQLAQEKANSAVIETNA